jgi:asparagine synthase (glutamine-hydrolysing)
MVARALKFLPEGRTLPTFTFHPEEAFDGRVPQWMMGDERPMVERFAAMHPRIEPHFTANEGYEHDYRLNELLHLIGGAPPGLCGTYVFHGLLAGAAKQGCDVLLVAEWGNQTFSDRGECAYFEYLYTGKWRQLWLALTRPQVHAGGMVRRFVARCIQPLLPDAFWHTMRRRVLGKEPIFEMMQPLSKKYRQASGADRRRKKSGWLSDRHQPWSRFHSRKLFIGHEDWRAEIDQGFEQMYGVALRDPMAYRPFVEFCLGLPTRMFFRDGEMRWLAKQMAKGIMPEEQRTTHLMGWWDVDWHLRIGRRRKDFLAELDSFEQDPTLARMLDFPALRASLEDWPEKTELDPQKFFRPQLGVPRALLTGRFVKFVEGRND